ncbi:MAG TPA: HU family DNA-binding protein [Bryobacteraceae bacterium]|jgi:nucleoid DNA-binding protein
MKKSDIAKRMARQSGTSVGQAADCLDRLVQEIVAGLRRGQGASLPGLGKLTVKPNGNLAFDREGARRHG